MVHVPDCHGSLSCTARLYQESAFSGALGLPGTLPLTRPAVAWLGQQRGSRGLMSWGLKPALPECLRSFDVVRIPQSGERIMRKAFATPFCPYYAFLHCAGGTSRYQAAAKGKLLSRMPGWWSAPGYMWLDQRVGCLALPTVARVRRQRRAY